MPSDTFPNHRLTERDRSAESKAERARVEHYFVSLCHGAVRLMREDGMNEVRIACVVTEIRSAAIEEEHRRLSLLRRDNPPTHHPFGPMMDALKPADGA